MRLFLINHQSPGDILMLTSAVRDLKICHSDIQINVETTAQSLWDNNPYLDKSVTKEKNDLCLKAEYPLIHQSTNGQHHFIHGFRKFLESKLNLKIEPGAFSVDVHMSKAEREDVWWIKQMTGEEKDYWLINAGHKNDYTNKYWEHTRFQEVIDATKHKIRWIQIGAKEHTHEALTGVVDMRSKTNHRELIRLMYRSGGVLTGVSYPMHLATIPMRDYPGRKRPCVVIAGGREPAIWETYTCHQFIHTCGMLECCKNGACWKSRVVKLEDGSNHDKSLCLKPVTSRSGQIIPKCMDMISSSMVIDSILRYLEYNSET